MMQAKILNSLGLIYAQRNETPKARRCMSSSLRIIAGHVGTDNWLYSRITANSGRRVSACRSSFIQNTADPAPSARGLQKKRSRNA
jgi:hypothetical protein